MHSQSIIPVLLIILLVAVLSFFLYTTTMNLTSEQLQYEPILPKPQIDSVFQDEENRLCITFFNPNDVNYTLTSPLILRRNDIEITTDLNVTLPPGTSIHCVEVNIPSSGSYSLSLPSEAITFPTPPLLSNTPSLSAPPYSPPPSATFSVTTCPYTCSYSSRVVSNMEVHPHIRRIVLDYNPARNMLLVVDYNSLLLNPEFNVLILDITDVSNPSVLYEINGYYPIAAPLQFFLDENRIVLSDDNGIVVINIESIPFVEGRADINYSNPLYFWSISRINKKVFVITGDNNLVIVDVSTPSTPTVLKYYTAQELNLQTYYMLFFIDELNILVINAFDVDGNYIVGFYRFIQPSTLILESNIIVQPAGGLTVAAYLSEDNLLLMFDDNGFMLVDISNITSPSIYMEINSFSNVFEVYPIYGRNLIAVSLKENNYTAAVYLVNYKVRGAIEVIEDTLKFVLSPNVSAPLFVTPFHYPDLNVFFLSGNGGMYILSLCGLPKYYGSYGGGYDVDVWIEKNVLFTGGGPNGWSVYDISNPFRPRLIFAGRDTAYNIHIVEERNLLFVFGGLTGSIYDISNEALPSLLSTFQTYGWGTVIPELNLLVSLEANLLVYDISNPSAPTLLSSSVAINTLASDVIRLGDTNVVAIITDNGIKNYDLTDPANPILVGEVNYTQGQTFGTYLPSRNIIIASGIGGAFTVFADVSDPYNPALIGTAKETQGHFAIDELNILTAATPVDNTSKLTTFNTTFIPYLVPEEVLLIAAWGEPKNVFDGNRFIAFGTDKVANICGYPRTKTMFPKDVNYVAIPIWIWDANRVYLFVMDNNSNTFDSLEVWDISALQSPQKLGELNTIYLIAPYYSDLQRLLVDANRVLVPDNNVLRLINLTNPSTPNEEWNVGFSSTILSLTYSSAWKKAIVIASAIITVDLSNLSSPQVTGSYVPGTLIMTSYPIEDRNMLATVEMNGADTLLVLRYYQDANNIPFLSSLVLSSPQGSLVERFISEKNWLLVTDYNRGFVIVDITDPLSPVLVWDQNVPEIISSDYLAEFNAIVAVTTTGYKIFNVKSVTSTILEEKTATLIPVNISYGSVIPSRPWIFLSDLSSNVSFVTDITLYDGWRP